MNTQLRVALTGCAVLACIASIAAAGSLLYEAMRGERTDLGAIGGFVLFLMVVGQCRALWVVCCTRARQVAEPKPAENAHETTQFWMPE